MLLTTSILKAGGITLLSLIVGAIMLGWLGIYYPEWLDWLLTLASRFKEIITNPAYTGISSSNNIWLKLLIHEQTFVLLFFVLLARIVLVILANILERLLGGLLAGGR